MGHCQGCPGKYDVPVKGAEWVSQYAPCPGCGHEEKIADGEGDGGMTDPMSPSVRGYVDGQQDSADRIAKLERCLAKAREALKIIADDHSSFWFALAERTLAAIEGEE